jgi:two-component system, chemotaxis family, chemotaxis protein CheY
MKQFVLVIDDDPIDCLIAQKVLESTNLTYEIVIKNSGSAAIELLTRLLQTKQRPPDHIFLDINMPGMDGFEVLQELVSRFEQELTTKIHFLTSSIYYKDRERALINKWVSNFFIKPFSVEKVLEVLVGQ